MKFHQKIIENSKGATQSPTSLQTASDMTLRYSIFNAQLSLQAHDEYDRLILTKCNYEYTIGSKALILLYVLLIVLV